MMLLINPSLNQNRGKLEVNLPFYRQGGGGVRKIRWEGVQRRRGCKTKNS